MESRVKLKPFRFGPSLNGMLSFWVLCVFCLAGAFGASANVLLIGKTDTSSFEDIEANFAPSVEGSGKCGELYVAEPLNACSALTNKILAKGNDTIYTFLLIVRGGCSFDEKVRRAQAAGFKAAIVYDNQNGDLIAMAGNSAGIRIYAVFVSKTAGETLAKYARVAYTDVWIVPSFENSAWSIMAMSFISLLAMSAILATCFFVQRHRIRRQQPQAPNVQEFHGMSSRLVKAMPSLSFTSVLEDNCTSRTCAICLEDYTVGDKIRILPCCHKFHCLCVDTWLTSWRTFCPVCKRDARTYSGEAPATESTPLLSSSPSASAPSYSVLSSVGSAAASAIYIGPSSNPYRSPTVSCPQSISSTAYNHNQYSLQSPHRSASQSSIDLRNMSSQRSNSGYLVSPHSFGYPPLSPLNSRYVSLYIPSPGNGSNSYVGSSGHPTNPLHHSKSAASLSPCASAQSLPGC